MPRYPFRCETCGLTFEVSRSMSDAGSDAPGSDAQCPADGARAVRVFTMPATNFNRPTGDSKPPASTTYSHYGHAHGADAARHSHGPARGPRGSAT